MKKLAVLVLFTLFFSGQLAAYKIAVLGTGYVGLVSGACLSYLGQTVVCADIDESKIKSLSNGVIPIYEANLQKLVNDGCQKNTLSFTADVSQAILEADIILIAVNTPSKENGKADLSALKSAIYSIAQKIKSYKLIVIKSTVPIGTNRKIYEWMKKQQVDTNLFDLVSNPEFLREGSAVADFLYSDRVVIGASSLQAAHIAREMYQNLSCDIPIVITDPTTAETIKYASNSFLAFKISFINELSNICDCTGAKIADVSHVMGLDKRIGKYFLQPGPGFGGSCFPKDSLALLQTSKELHSPMLTLDALIKANELQKHIPIKKLKQLIGNDLKDRRIAILGLAFKANTDDIRYSPSLKTIELLLKEGARVCVFDPKAMQNCKKIYPTIHYCNDAYETVKDAEAMILMTEWPEFAELRIEIIGQLMKKKIVVDCRNILDPVALAMHNFRFQTMGNGGTKKIVDDYYFSPDIYA